MSAFGGKADMTRMAQHISTLAFHKRCSTIERNSTTIIATIKSVTCRLALGKWPGRWFGSCIVMGDLLKETSPNLPIRAPKKETVQRDGL